MWAKVESGSVTEIYRSPKRLTIGDVQYPSNIFQMWTNTELSTLNIYPVVQDNTNLKGVVIERADIHKSAQERITSLEEEIENCPFLFILTD